ncbi:MAG: dual specificity protein phosphatase family protein [Planctomycetota bacterium]|nr:dual specificity protein phosphatase family protein [Planctomycetota bacterium]
MSRVFTFRNWWDEADPGLLLGARPSPNDAEQLAQLGVTGVVNTCDEYKGPKSTYAKLKIEQLYIPTIDFTHPRIEDVEAAVEFITSHVNQGGRVYVHCKAGRARSATVAICWLIGFRKMDPAEAQNHLVRIRHQVNRRLLSRPVVQEFIKRDLAKKAAR